MTSTQRLGSLRSNDVVSLTPKCPNCRKEYSITSNTPYSLDCGHSVCCKCLKQSTRNNRRCPACLSRYHSYQINLASLDLLVNLKLITGTMSSCNECLYLVPMESIRQCFSCEEEVRERANLPRVSCMICPECALEMHRDHDLRRVAVIQYGQKQKYAADATSKHGIQHRHEEEDSSARPSLGSKIGKTVGKILGYGMASVSSAFGNLSRHAKDEQLLTKRHSRRLSSTVAMHATTTREDKQSSDRPRTAEPSGALRMRKTSEDGSADSVSYVNMEPTKASSTAVYANTILYTYMCPA